MYPCDDLTTYSYSERGHIPLLRVRCTRLIYAALSVVHNPFSSEILIVRRHYRFFDINACSLLTRLIAYHFVAF